jgi:hypothetical protein
LYIVSQPYSLFQDHSEPFDTLLFEDVKLSVEEEQSQVTEVVQEVVVSAAIPAIILLADAAFLKAYGHLRPRALGATGRQFLDQPSHLLQGQSSDIRVDQC